MCPNFDFERQSGSIFLIEVICSLAHFTLGCKSVFCRFSFMAAQLAGEPFHHGLVWSQIMYIYDMGWKLGMVQTKQIQCLSYLRFTTTLSNIFLFRITLNLIFRQFQFQSRIIHPNMTLWKLKVCKVWNTSRWTLSNFKVGHFLSFTFQKVLFTLGPLYA